jgi:hypothetical protein
MTSPDKYKHNTPWTETDDATIAYQYKHKNYDLAEMADLMGRSQGAVKKRLQQLGEWRGSPNSPKEKVRRMIKIRNMPREEYSYYKDLLSKPRWSMEDALNLCIMVHKYPADITKIENYSKVARVR